MNPTRLLPILLIVMALTACEQSSNSSAIGDPVLARVGDSAIRQSQLDVMLDRLTPEKLEHDNTRFEATLLQGMVRTRALAAVAEQQMSAEERMQLEARVQTYRDELLAQSYIKNNIVPQPVTAEMVTKYYRDHLADYAVPGKLSFEYMVTTSNTLDDDVLNDVLDAFTKAKNTADWKPYAAALKQKNIPVEYRLASMVSASINNELRGHITKLQPGEVSDVVFGEYIYVAKLVKREPDVVKPMHEVSIDIRKKLAPQKLKQALAQHIDQAMQDMNVEYNK